MGTAVLLKKTAPPPPVIPNMGPSAPWDGTGGKGYTVFPLENIGSGPKPIAQWDVPEYQEFTTDFKIGVVASHRDGVQKVTFYCEGNSGISIQDVTTPSMNPRTNVFEYWVNLKVASGYFDLVGGDIEVYAEVFPGAPSTQTRVIGRRLVANPNNILQTTQAKIFWDKSAAGDGNDGSTPALARKTWSGICTRVYQTIGGYNAPEICIVRDGSHALSTSIPFTPIPKRYIVLRPATAAELSGTGIPTPTNIVLTSPSGRRENGGIFFIRKIRLQDITLDIGKANGFQINGHAHFLRTKIIDSNIDDGSVCDYSLNSYATPGGYSLFSSVNNTSTWTESTKRIRANIAGALDSPGATPAFKQGSIGQVTVGSPMWAKVKVIGGTGVVVGKIVTAIKKWADDTIEVDESIATTPGDLSNPQIALQITMDITTNATWVEATKTIRQVGAFKGGGPGPAQVINGGSISWCKLTVNGTGISANKVVTGVLKISNDEITVDQSIAITPGDLSAGDISVKVSTWVGNGVAISAVDTFESFKVWNDLSAVPLLPLYQASLTGEKMILAGFKAKETLYTGDGVTTAFSGAVLTSPPVQPNMIRLYWTSGGIARTVMDTGNQGLGGDSTFYTTYFVSSSINYSTGAINLTFKSSYKPDNGTLIQAEYVATANYHEMVCVPSSNPSGSTIRKLVEWINTFYSSEGWRADNGTTQVPTDFSWVEPQDLAVFALTDVGGATKKKSVLLKSRFFCEDCTATKAHFSWSGAHLQRNTVTDPSFGEAFILCRCLLNCRALNWNTDAFALWGANRQHIDLIQLYGKIWDNCVFFNVIGKGITPGSGASCVVQPIFMDHANSLATKQANLIPWYYPIAAYRNIVFVNTYQDFSGVHSQLNGSHKHVLFYNLSHMRGGLPLGRFLVRTDGINNPFVNDGDVVFGGCIFDGEDSANPSFSPGTASFTWVGRNAFRYGTAFGSNPITGDPQIGTDGIPSVGSPCIDQLGTNWPIKVDVVNSTRSNADVGAYEKV